MRTHLEPLEFATEAAEMGLRQPYPSTREKALSLPRLAPPPVFAPISWPISL